MTELPRLFPTIVHMLADASTHAPAKLALKDERFALTYRDYERCVAGCALRLRAFAGAGDTIVICAQNSAAMAIAMLGVMAAGLRVCTINPAYTARELRQILTDAAPALIIGDEERLATIAAANESGAPLRDLAFVSGSIDIWRADVTLVLQAGVLNPDASAVLQFTGGTSGRAKGVQLTHRAVAANVSQREAMLPAALGGENILCLMPLYHAFAASMCLYLALHSRGALIIQARYKPDLALKALTDEAITIFPAGPTVFISLLNYPPFLSAPPVQLRWCYSGSAALANAVHEDWKRVTGVEIYEGYGQTEAGPILSFNSPILGSRTRSVGRAAPGTQIQIVDPIDGAHVLPAGEIGEIRARGPQIMSGYLNLPQETADTLREGWLYTGDLGRIDEDGFLTIEDRKKEMAIVSGYNVFPREVDEVLCAFEGVAEAATIGAPDPYRGETLKSYIVAKQGCALKIEALQAHCADNLAKYKLPSEIRIVDDLPRTAIGKVDKKALRDLHLSSGEAR
jgi:long-chain acyl-CoA synthetase